MVEAAMDYIRDPQEIYRESFATIRREADLSRFPGGLGEIAVRVIHACGMVDIVDDLVMTPDAAKAGRTALDNGCAIICDVEMVRHGIMRRLLPNQTELLCNVGSEAATQLASDKRTTRSAAAIETLSDRLPGSIVAIGNAPTALFHLLDLLDRGLSPPALIVAAPVGFVGAAESKESLIADAGAIPHVVVRGRRGGSAMAASIVNAIAGGLKT